MENSEEEEGGFSFLGNSEEEKSESNGLEDLAIQEDYSMDAMKELDPDFLLKIDLMLISFSTEVTFFEELIFFYAGAFSVLSEGCEGNLKDEEVSKRCVSFLIGKF